MTKNAIQTRYTYKPTNFRMIVDRYIEMGVIELSFYDSDGEIVTVEIFNCTLLISKSKDTCGENVGTIIDTGLKLFSDDMLDEGVPKNVIKLLTQFSSLCVFFDGSLELIHRK